MEKNFVLNGNKLIAEFIGFKKTNTKDVWSTVEYLEENPNSNLPCSVPVTDYLYFDKSWDALMPVVEKIEELGYTTSFKTTYVRINPKKNCSYYNYISYLVFTDHGWYLKHPYPSYDDEADYAPIDRGDNKIGKLEAIYRIIVEFIKWYNEQNSSKT